MGSAALASSHRGTGAAQTDGASGGSGLRAGSSALKSLLVLAGLGQLTLALGSLALPRVLRWKDDTAKLRPLTRQVFWTYAAYIWVTNVCFGLLSTFASGRLLDNSLLARAVNGYITAYWGARLLVQFFYFDRSEAPPGVIYKLAEVALATLFVFLTLVYGYLFVTGG